MDWEERDPTVNFHGGNEFSTEAHASIVEGKAITWRQIWDLMRRHPDGLTCDGVQAITGKLHQTLSARFTELKGMGRISPAGHRRTRSGRMAGVWKAVPEHLWPAEKDDIVGSEHW